MNSNHRVEENSESEDRKEDQCEAHVIVEDVSTEKQRIMDKQQAYKDAVCHCIRKDL